MAMARRLHDLKLLSDWQYRSVVIELSQRGYRSADQTVFKESNLNYFAKSFS